MRQDCSTNSAITMDERWQLIRLRAATVVFFPFAACIEMIRVQHTPNAIFWGRLVEVAGGAASSEEEAPSHALLVITMPSRTRLDKAGGFGEGKGTTAAEVIDSSSTQRCNGRWDGGSVTIPMDSGSGGQRWGGTEYQLLCSRAAAGCLHLPFFCVE